MLDPQALKILALCAVLLFFKMAVLGIFQSATRSRLKAYTVPEDALLLGKTEPVTAEHPDLLRANNAYRNDLENIPVFLSLALIFLHLHAGDGAAMVYFPLFTLARIGHSIFYVRGLQPWRSISYGVGLLCTVVMSGQIVFAALR
ncbi:MAG: MAPEG family protein [Candidatus Sericytochromatia bacterium]